MGVCVCVYIYLDSSFDYDSLDKYTLCVFDSMFISCLYLFYHALFANFKLSFCVNHFYIKLIANLSVLLLHPFWRYESTEFLGFGRKGLILA